VLPPLPIGSRKWAHTEHILSLARHRVCYERPCLVAGRSIRLTDKQVVTLLETQRNPQYKPEVTLDQAMSPLRTGGRAPVT
jgi:hypothetical protein